MHDCHSLTLYHCVDGHENLLVSVRQGQDPYYNYYRNGVDVIEGYIRAIKHFDKGVQIEIHHMYAKSLQDIEGLPFNRFKYIHEW